MSEEPELLAVMRDIESPPGGWKYTVPQTGVTIRDGWFRGLWKKTRDHLIANGIEVGEDYKAIVEHGACCETKPPGSWCSKPKPKPVADGLPVPLLMYVERFLRSIWGALKNREFVPREEAERRLAVCLQCPLRSTLPGGCQSCFTVLKSAMKLMDKNPLKIEPDEDGTVRDACSACWCLIPAKVLIGNKVLDRAEGEKRPNYAPGCWRNGG